MFKLKITILSFTVELILSLFWKFYEMFNLLKKYSNLYISDSSAEWDKSLSNQFYKSRLVNKIISKIAGLPFANEIMTKHVLAARDIFDNHRIQLVKLVVTLYVEIRLFHECRKSNMPKDYIRHQLSKFILFKNQ